MTGSKDRRDHYAVLGVEPTASGRQVTSAYRSLVRLLHPDTRPLAPGSTERLGAVVAAYEVLHDPELRAAYDAERRTARPRPRSRAAGAWARPPAARRRVSVRVVREGDGAQPVRSAPTPSSAAMPYGAEPLVRVGPVRIEPPVASVWARDGADDLWEWIQHRLWEVDPWL
ncbi:J domain-containing protein [Streptomyces sp. SP17BM10]|uniref:J domain-containing protein n=1 Tax=Streptomyces sp. SP17BM10 TaxID=3002530 RepID=UPI002E777017|nr:J domain-containing protein [Streptomyces sp. SP17BM10]MEE1784949.1 J domain-containing protein [Streptomyces sp. SP17BM10]